MDGQHAGTGSYQPATTGSQQTVNDARPGPAAAPISLVLVSTKDSDRAPNDKFGAMDAGYVSQNIYLACTALGLRTVARATMDFDVLKRELNLADTSYLELNHPIGY